ncbi:MAG: hypothetical protein ACYTEW_25035 [Planctomycetota bacterium]|jgi:hypothetical protein
MTWGRSRTAFQDVIDAERAVNDWYRRLVDNVSIAVPPNFLSLPTKSLTEFGGPEEEVIDGPGMSSKIQITICSSVSRAITLTITPVTSKVSIMIREDIGHEDNM